MKFKEEDMLGWGVWSVELRRVHAWRAELDVAEGKEGGE